MISERCKVLLRLCCRRTKLPPLPLLPLPCCQGRAAAVLLRLLTAAAHIGSVHLQHGGRFQ